MEKRFKKWKTGFLTEQELAVLELDQKGHKQEDIADKLGIRQSAVSHALRSIKEKTTRAVETVEILKKVGVLS